MNKTVRLVKVVLKLPMNKMMDFTSVVFLFLFLFFLIESLKQLVPGSIQWKRKAPLQQEMFGFGSGGHPTGFILTTSYLYIQ